MKLKDIFKKSAKAAPTSKVQKLEKKQLEKVIGGAEEQAGKAHYGSASAGRTS